MKILNLYAGIGGNRKLWGDEHEITAIEINPEIAIAIKNSKCFGVSLSWGKDSVVMAHLIHSICKKGHYIFANTKCEYPETYKYRDMMLKGMFKNYNYIETEPIKSFNQCVKEYGYPTLRQPTGQGNKRTPKCCKYLKEDPLQNKFKELKIDLNFMGLQCSESMNRRLLFMRLGGYYHKKPTKRNVCLPLAIWTDKDIVRYAKENKITLNPLYKKMKRTGCMFCTGFKDWKKVMAKYNPTMYSMILFKKENQKTIDCGWS